MEEKDRSLIAEFLKWVKHNCTQRTTSRSNLYNTYWQVKSTGVLYKDEELFDYWTENVKV